MRRATWRRSHPLPHEVFAKNLQGAELTPLERSYYIAEWMRLTDEKGKAKAQVVPSAHTGGRPNKGINAATRELGLERTKAQRASLFTG